MSSIRLKDLIDNGKINRYINKSQTDRINSNNQKQSIKVTDLLSLKKSV